METLPKLQGISGPQEFLPVAKSIVGGLAFLLQVKARKLWTIEYGIEKVLASLHCSIPTTARENIEKSTVYWIQPLHLRCSTTKCARSSTQFLSLLVCMLPPSSKTPLAARSPRAAVMMAAAMARTDQGSRFRRRVRELQHLDLSRA